MRCAAASAAGRTHAQEHAPSCAGREELLDQEVEGAELDAELAPVTLQLALVDARQGRVQEADEAFKVPHGLRASWPLSCHWVPGSRRRMRVAGRAALLDALSKELGGLVRNVCVIESADGPARTHWPTCLAWPRRWVPQLAASVQMSTLSAPACRRWPTCLAWTRRPLRCCTTTALRWAWPLPTRPRASSWASCASGARVPSWRCAPGFATVALDPVGALGLVLGCSSASFFRRAQCTVRRSGFPSTYLC